MIELTFKKGKERWSARYPVNPGPEFISAFSEIGLCYWHSAKKSKSINVTNMRQATAELITQYAKLNTQKPVIVGKPKPDNPTKEVANKKQIAAVGLTGGKDSAHLLLKLLKENKFKKVLAFYVPGINKSETVYEKKAVKDICSKLGVEYTIVPTINSVQLNRLDHNIGLREPLALVTAAPYLKSLNVDSIYFGTVDSFFDIDPKLFGSSKLAAELVLKRLNQDGQSYPFTIHNHAALKEKFSSTDIFHDMVNNHRDVLDLTSSCYTQINFREKRNADLKNNFPLLPLYHGCGHCLKCRRINAAILANLKNGKAAVLKQFRESLSFMEGKEGSKNDRQFRELVGRAVENYKRLTR